MIGSRGRERNDQEECNGVLLAHEREGERERERDLRVGWVSLKEARSTASEGWFEGRKGSG
jgi:hypothetical protein